jgi:hypothetical protein
MKLVGRISVVFEAANFIEAGAHQSALEELRDLFRQRYPQAELEISQRRQRRPGVLERAPQQPLDARRLARR